VVVLIAAQAQWLYTINNNTITITEDAGLGGEVEISNTVNGYPGHPHRKNRFSTGPCWKAEIVQQQEMQT